MSEILVNYAALENANGRIQTTAQGIEQKLADLRKRLQNMQWEGQDQAAYAQHQAAWDQAIGDLNAILQQIGSAVGTARENYMSTEANNAKVW